MSLPKYTKIEDDAPNALNLPPYSGPPCGSALAKDYGETPPPQYQPYNNAAGAGISYGPVLPSSQTTCIVHVPPSNEPDYLGYSIFTLLCCCLPLGVAALVYSVKTQEANRAGNRVAAQRNSRLARILAHTALGIGLGFLVLYIIMSVINYIYVINSP